MMAATIKYEPEDFKKATLKTSSCAEITATLANDNRDAFRIVSWGWHFCAEDCREAADFFLKLAEELERKRKG